MNLLKKSGSSSEKPAKEENKKRDDINPNFIDIDVNSKIQNEWGKYGQHACWTR